MFGFWILNLDDQIQIEYIFPHIQMVVCISTGLIIMCSCLCPLYKTCPVVHTRLFRDPIVWNKQNLVSFVSAATDAKDVQRH